MVSRSQALLDAASALLDSGGVDSDLGADQALPDALGALVEVARTRPHLYRLMFTRPADDAATTLGTAAAVGAATLARDAFWSSSAESSNTARCPWRGCCLRPRTALPTWN